MTEDAKSIILLGAAALCVWLACGYKAEDLHNKDCLKHRSESKDGKFLALGPLAFLRPLRKLFICNR